MSPDMNGAGPHPNYARAALEAECAIVANTTSGRNAQINKSAFSLSQLCAAGLLDSSEVEHRLMQAAEASGYVGKDGRPAALATIRSGMAQGSREPRAVPEPSRSNGHHHNGHSDAKAWPQQPIEARARKPAPRVSDVPIPNWTVPDSVTGRPQFVGIGEDLPPQFANEVANRRHIYRRDGQAVRAKIKMSAGKAAFIDLYRVRRPDDGAIGWQAKKPSAWVPVPYVGKGSSFDPELAGETLFWTEGEKDVDSLAGLGLAAFTYGGSADVPLGCETLLRDRDVVILSDNDEPGRACAERKMAVLRGVARRVRVIEFAELKPGGDVSDFMAAGGTIEDLWARVDAAPAIEEPAPQQPEPEPEPPGAGESQWEPPRGSTAPPPLKITARPFVWRDPKTFPRRRWLYGYHLIRKFISCTVAPGGVGKTSLVLVEAVAMATGRPLLGVKTYEGKLKVWVINLEDPLEELERRVIAICLHFDIDPAELDGQLFLNSGRDTSVIFATTTRSGTVVAQPVVDAMTAEIQAKRADVVVIDPLVKAHRVPENDNGAIDMVCTAIAGIADVTDCAFDLIHHVRKTNGAEVTVEDGRGAVALLSAARSARALNRMTAEEAEKAGVADFKGFFRSETGKANLAPADKADWFRLRDVPLGNGDEGHPFDSGDRVAVAEAWVWPDALADVTVTDLRAVQKVVEAGRWRENAQSPDWVGKAVAQALKLNSESKSERAKIASLLRTWIGTGMLSKVEGLDEKRKSRTYVEVGKWASD